MQRIREFWGVYQKLSKPEKAVFWNTVCSFMIKGIQFFMIPVYVRLMPPCDYGAYTVAYSWAEILLILTSVNMFSNTYTVALAKWSDEKDEMTSSMVTFCLLSSILWCAVLLAAHAGIEQESGLSFPILCSLMLYIVFEPVKLFWCAMQRFENQYKALIGVTLLDVIMNLFFGTAFILGARDKALAAIFAKAFTEFLVGMVLIVRIYKKKAVFFRRKYWTYAAGMNVPLIPFYLSLRILQHLDRLMINRMVGSAEAAVYSFAYNITNTLMILNNSINGAFTPYLYRALKKRDMEPVSGLYTVLLLIIGGSNILLVLFAPEVVSILGTEKYGMAVYMIPPLAVSSTVIYLYDQFVNVELFFEEKRWNALIAVLISAVNGALNYVCIRKFGAIAASYTTLLSYLVFAGMHYIYYRLTCRKNGIRRRLFHPVVIPAVMAAVMILSVTSVILYGSFAGRSLLFSALGIFTLINKNRIISNIKKARRNL